MTGKFPVFVAGLFCILSSPLVAVATDIPRGCHSSDPNRVCLAIKYVVFDDAAGNGIVSHDEAMANIRTVNAVWDKCGIGFQIEKYQAVNSGDYSIDYQIGTYTDLDTIRNSFGDESTLLVATTGPWNRAAALGNTGANAWTSMPGGGPYGAVLEGPVGKNSNLIAHELGHYLNLPHVRQAGDLMNPIIYSNSTQISNAQCATARSAAQSFWQKMLR